MSNSAQQNVNNTLAQYWQQYGGQVDPTLQKYLQGGQYVNPNTISSADQLARYAAINAAPGGLEQIEQNAYQVDPNAFGQDSLNQYAYDQAKTMLGRSPTTTEWAQLLPAFQGPNGRTNGSAYLATLQQQQQADPNNPNSSLNPNNPGYQDKTKPYQDQVTQQFQSLLGRAPTDAELQHYSGALAGGQLDQYGLQSYLQQMPEYQNAQDATFRSGINTELQGFDQTEFDREKGDVMSDYAKRGFAPGNSPSLDYAMTDLMGKLAQNRQSYLTQLSAQQYGGNKQIAEGNYQQTLDQMNQNNQANRQNTQNLLNSQIQRGNQGADYQTQMNDYMNYANANKGGGSNPLYGAAGGIVGAIGGGMAAGPQGAMVGYQVGQGAGNAFGYLNQ